MEDSNYLPPARDFTEKEGDLYYTGLSLGRCIETIAADRYIRIHRDNKTWRVELCDNPTDEAGAEWGAGPTPNDALRYAISAYFGPLDEGFAGDMANAPTGEPLTIGVVLHPDTGEVYDRVYNWETAQTYAGNGYKVAALNPDGELWPVRRIQAMCDAETAQFMDCFGRTKPFDY